MQNGGTLRDVLENAGFTVADLSWLRMIVIFCYSRYLELLLIDRVIPTAMSSANTALLDITVMAMAQA